MYLVCRAACSDFVVSIITDTEYFKNFDCCGDTAEIQYDPGIPAEGFIQSFLGRVTLSLHSFLGGA